MEKNVVNINDGSVLGCVSDLEICPENGRVTSVIVTGYSKIPIFGKEKEYSIDWCHIKCIGDEVILVDIPPDNKR